VCEEGQQCQQALHLSRATQYHDIVPDVIAHSAAISARERASSAGRPYVS